jgi:MoaA/NifB/PqqE/SkfB family radical SAM enzyme
MIKKYRSPDYNYNFDTETGFFAKWGKTLEDDPVVSPACELLDLEASTICNQGCRFCYKSNTPNGKNMSLETFKKLLDKILETNKVLTQIAFGSGATAEENPDMWNIMAYCREKGIIPNITVANISDETADRLVKYCGAVAVSRYANKDICYDSVQKLSSRGLKQTNIHQFLSSQNYEQALETVNDATTDERLKGLNAIVFLSLKQKGRAVENGFTPLSQDKYTKLVELCFEKKIGFGSDSCGAHKVMKAIENRPDKESIDKMISCCESSLESFYINVDAEGFPCSFIEGTKGWETGLDILGCKSFVDDVWNHSRLIEFRDTLLKNCRNCPIYNV